MLIDNMIDIFTSCNLSYLAKARVLAYSVKKFHPEVRMHLMLSDILPAWLDLEKEPFDSIITPVDLETSNAWIFKHSVVELCTAVKPFCFQYILKKYSGAAIFYLDPDIVLFSKIDGLIEMLLDTSILLTPHVCIPESQIQAVVDNEISSLMHGIYNLGFLAVKNDSEGRNLIDWWASRLTHFCQDNIPMGLFTDQRWMDFAPVFFTKLKIVREPIYNVATWNYSTRNLSGSINEGIEINGAPICFHHFSGVDNGASVMMLSKYCRNNPTAWELDRWYKDECRKRGQDEVSAIPWAYGYYDNGEEVGRNDRVLYRNSADLQEEFLDPFSTSVPGKKYGVSFYEWLASTRSTAAPILRPFPDFLHDTQLNLLAYVRRSSRLPKYLQRLITFLLPKLFGIVSLLIKRR